MPKSGFFRAVVAVLGLSILSACAGSGMRIGNTVTLCCPGNYASYNSYSVEASGLPIFLREYVTAEFDKAFQERGMVRNDGNSDIIVNLNYRHVSLDPDQQDIDPFVRMESMNLELHYIANIDILMSERRGGKEVWGGTISRVHTVQPGEYMHQEYASSAFLDTFRELLTEYPHPNE